MEATYRVAGRHCRIRIYLSDRIKKLSGRRTVLDGR